jgi:TolA-binding protein
MLALCLALALAANPHTAPAPAPALAIQDSPDDRYRYLSGLAEKGMHELVVKEAEAFLRQHGTHGKAEHARYRLAASLFELGKKREAVPHFERGANAEGFEFRAEAAFRLAQCALDAGDVDVARRALAIVDAGKRDYLASPAAFLRGEMEFKAGEFAAAAAAYESALATDGAAAHARDARYGLAFAHFRCREFAAALAAIDAFLGRHGEDPARDEMRLLRGEALLELDRPQEARAAFAAIEATELRPAARRGAGFASLAARDRAGAERDFAAALEAEPGGRFAAEVAMQLAALKLEAKDAEGALAALLAVRPPDGAAPSPEFLLWRARAKRGSGDADGALADLQLAARSEPDAVIAPQLEMLRGDLLADRGDVDAATKAYAKASNDYALHAAAITRLNAGDVDGAATLAAALLERFADSPYVPHARIVLGEAAFARGDHGAATPHFEAAAERGDAAIAARAAARLAWCAHLGGDHATAARRFAAVAAAATTEPAARSEAQAMLARCCEALGRHDDAIAAYRACLGIDGGDPVHRRDALLSLLRLETPQAAEPRIDAVIALGDEAAGDALLALAQRAGEVPLAARVHERIVNDLGATAAAEKARYALAYECFGRGELDAAREWLAGFHGKTPSRDPELATAALELAVFVDAKRGDGRAAAAALERWTSSAKLSRAAIPAERRLELTRLVARSLAAQGDAMRGEELLAALGDSGGASRAAIAGERALLALDRGDVDAAEKLVLGAGTDESPPALAEAAFFVAEKRFEEKAFDRAIELYERTLAGSDPARYVPEALYKAGFAALLMGRHGEAATRFERLTTQHADSKLALEGLFLLGEARYRDDRFEAAIAPLEELRKREPRHDSIAKALFRLGLALARLDRLTEAEGPLTDLVKRFPEFPNLAEAELWRGRALVARGATRPARQAFERTLSLDTGELAARARIEIGRLEFEAGAHEQALSEFLKVAVLFAIEDVVAESLLLAGVTLEAMGDSKLAGERYRELIARFPQSTYATSAEERLAAIAGVTRRNGEGS